MSNAFQRINYFLTMAKNIDPAKVSVTPTEEELDQLTLITAKETGFPNDIAIYVRSPNNNKTPTLRITKGPWPVDSYEDTFLVSVSIAPKVVAGVSTYPKEIMNFIFSWVKLNRKTLIDFWRSDCPSSKRLKAELLPIRYETYTRLQKISGRLIGVGNAFRLSIRLLIKTFLG